MQTATKDYRKALSCTYEMQKAAARIHLPFPVPGGHRESVIFSLGKYRNHSMEKFISDPVNFAVPEQTRYNPHCTPRSILIRHYIPIEVADTTFFFNPVFLDANDSLSISGIHISTFWFCGTRWPVMGNTITLPSEHKIKSKSLILKSSVADKTKLTSVS